MDPAGSTAIDEPLLAHFGFSKQASRKKAQHVEIVVKAVLADPLNHLEQTQGRGHAEDLVHVTSPGCIEETVGGSESLLQFTSHRLNKNLLTK